MKAAKIFLLLFISVTFTTNAQLVERWKTYTDMKQVRHFSISDDIFWAATSGGAFQYNLSNNEYSVFTKTNGLNGSPLTSLTKDNDGKIWFGSQNGIIDVYNPSNNSFKRILDIFNTERIGKTINELVAIGDTIYTATNFGLSLINSEQYFFYDTFFRFGTFASNIKVNSSYRDGLLYVCTEQGLAVQKPGAVNLSAPESWNVFTTANGLPSNNALNLVKLKDTLLLATERGIVFFNGLQWSEYLSFYTNRYIKSIAVSNNILYILWEVRLPQNRVEYNIGIYNEGNHNPNYFNALYPVYQLSVDKNGELFAATQRGIIKISSDEVIVPNGPQSSQFVNLDVDQNGNLWAASGRDATGAGFYKFNGSFWENYNTSTTSQLNTNSFHTVLSTQNGDIYAGSWGSGFIRIRNNNIQVFNASNTGMQGIAVNPDFLVIGGFATDAAGNLWIMNHDPVNRRPISMLTPDSTWYHFSNRTNLNVNQYMDIVVDRSNTKWFISQSPGSGGLYYFNENNSLTDSTRHVSGYVSQTTGLNSNSLTSMAIDRRGDLWVASNLGLNIISNLNTVLTNQPQLRISSVFAVRQQTVNAIAVDALNQKWVATNQGLLVLSSDGTNLLYAFDTRNSPLISDIITSLAIDQVRGIVYAGSESGLSVIYTTALQPVDEFTELFIYPNPLRLENGSNQQITIDGLIRDSEIKILNSSGQLIKQFVTPGGKIAFWDGRNEFGDLVPSGVYFVVAYDREANNIITGKVAVLRK